MTITNRKNSAHVKQNMKRHKTTGISSYNAKYGTNQRKTAYLDKETKIARKAQNTGKSKYREAQLEDNKMEPAAPEGPKHVAKKMKTTKNRKTNERKKYLSLSDWRRNSFCGSLNTNGDGAARFI